jgi:hypothetical protein
MIRRRFAMGPMPGQGPVAGAYRATDCPTSAIVASDGAREPIAPRCDAPEAWLRTTSTGWKAATDRILGHPLPQTRFDGRVHVGYRQDTISASQYLDHGPLDHTVAEPLRLGDRCNRPSPARTRTLGSPFENSSKEHIVV